MSETDRVVFDTSVSVRAPLSRQVRRRPDDPLESVIVVGTRGAVELQIRLSFEPWFRVCDGQAVVDELDPRRRRTHPVLTRATTWLFRVTSVVYQAIHTG